MSDLRREVERRLKPYKKNGVRPWVYVDKAVAVAVEVVQEHGRKEYERALRDMGYEPDAIRKPTTEPPREARCGRCGGKFGWHYTGSPDCQGDAIHRA